MLKIAVIIIAVAVLTASSTTYEEFFRTVDKDGTGFLEKGEFGDYFKSVAGYTNDQVDTIFNGMDTTGDGKVSLAEYTAAMTAAPQPQVSALRRVCQAFDKNGNGFIDNGELKDAFEELGRNLSDQDVKRIAGLADTDNSGTIDYNEFTEKMFGQPVD